MKYRLHSVAFGEYLEKMATGLIPEFVNYLSTYGSNGYYSCYYSVKWELTGKYNTDRVYIIEINDNATIEQVIKGLNEGYAKFFVYDWPDVIDDINIRISIEDYTWDKYGKTYLKVLKIDDLYFCRYHEEAIRFRL